VWRSAAIEAARAPNPAQRKPGGDGGAIIAVISSPWRAISSWDTSICMPTQQAQSQADLGIALRIVIERSVDRLDALKRSLHINEARLIN
jgi:hypothetical protein